MENNIKFAILKYIPDLERNETINVAVVVHYINSKKIKMATISNWKRISKFDDEADIKFLKSYVQDIESQFTMNLTNDFDGIQLDDPKLLDELTKYFVNKFVFEIHQTLSSMEFTDFLEYIKKVYLYYDSSKKNRISEKEAKLFIERNMLDNNVRYDKIGSKNAVYEEYGNNVSLDYKIGDDFYKVIFLNDHNYKKYIPTLKMWITNSILLKKENKKLIFIVDEVIENETTKKYKKMLSDFAEVIDKKDFIKSLINKEDKK